MTKPQFEPISFSIDKPMIDVKPWRSKPISFVTSNQTQIDMTTVWNHLSSVAELRTSTAVFFLMNDGKDAFETYKEGAYE